MASALMPKALYQIYEYPRGRQNFKKDTQPRRPVGVYVILDSLSDTGLAKCFVYWYTERPAFLPPVRKGAKLYLPAHFLKVPDKFANLHSKPTSWVAAMEAELANETTKLKIPVVKAIVEAATKVIRPDRIVVKKGQVWISPKGNKVKVIDIGSTIAYQENRKVKYAEQKVFLDVINKGGYLLEVPADDLIGKVTEILKPYIPAALVTLLAGWLIKKLGIFSVSAALTEDLERQVQDWSEQFLTCDSYEAMQELLQIFLNAEALQESERPFVLNYVNQLRYKNGLRRL